MDMYGFMGSGLEIAKLIGFLAAMFYSLRSFGMWRRGEKLDAIWHLLVALWFLIAIKY